MTLEQFWKIIEKVHRKSGTDMDKRFEMLEEELGKLSLAEVQSFELHFQDCLDRSYRWELWGAAYVMGGGCGNDGFWDFRSTLITCGRKIFEQALKEPESLAELPYELGDSLQVEGLQYIAGKVAERLGGDLLERSRQNREKPSGQRWDEANVAKLYPRLAEKYDYHG